MFVKQQLACIFILCTSICAATDEFPAPIIRCHADDEKCMVNQANTFFRTFANGLPEMGISQLEPLALDRIEILGDKHSATHFNLILTDVKVYNYSKSEVTSLKFSNKSLANNDKLLKVVLKSKSDQTTFKAKYRSDGQILVLPIRGEGDLVWRLTDVRGLTTVLFKREARADGKHYLSIVDMKLETKPKNLHTHMTNLFNGDKVLSENILQVINENWQLIGDDIMKTVNAAIAKSHAHDLNIFFKNIPFENFFATDDNTIDEN